MRVLALLKYGAKAASTRQRVLQYLPALAAADIAVECHSLIPDDLIGRLRSPSGVARMGAAYAARLARLFTVSRFDAVWVHKEVFPMMPGWLESLVARLGVPVIYDFDDAVFHTYDRSASGLVRLTLGKRLAPLLRRSAVALCGNAYLRDYAARFCPNSLIVPTTVDTAVYVPATAPHAMGAPPLVGWIGSPTTWPNVEPLVPLLERLVREGIMRVRVIGTGRPPSALPHFEVADWSARSEIAELQALDIGIMPLLDEPWNYGKCGFKLIQYMACGVASIGAPVGANREIMVDGRTSLPATSIDDWESALRTLVADPARRAALGAAGRERVEQRYSLTSQAPRIIAAIRSVQHSAARA